MNRKIPPKTPKPTKLININSEIELAFGDFLALFMVFISVILVTDLIVRISR
jgi:hypothetical protein